MLSTGEPVSYLRAKPAVHQLCAGAWLQAPFRLSSDVVAVPFGELGFTRQAEHLSRYVIEIIRGQVDQPAFESLTKAGANALPVIALCAPIAVDARPEELEALAAERLDRGRQALAWATGEEIVPFGMVVVGSGATHFRMLPPHSRRRQRLFGLGGARDDFQASLSSIVKVAEVDEHFAYALSLHHDALREVNPRFRIGRLFNVLECLAYRLKSEARPSRKAVKYLIGLEDEPPVMANIGGKEYRYDCVEIGGRVRDKLFHGVPFRAEHLNLESRAAFELYEHQPQVIADGLAVHCEIQIARWANGSSRGLGTMPSNEGPGIGE